MQDGSSRGPREDALPNAVMQEDDERWTALHEAASTGDDKKVQAILSANADRTAKESKHGNTPLHESAWRGYSRCVKVLCAPPNPKKELKDKKLKGVVLETRGALHAALLGIRNDGGFSALHLAAQNGHNQSCREILLAGADPDVQNNYGDTALHTACRYGHAGATRILLSASCNPQKTNLNGDSPLHVTCAMGRRKLTRILLEAECSRSIKNAQDETPRDIAIRKNYGEILDILDNPLKMRNRREKDKSSGSAGRGTTGKSASDCKTSKAEGAGAAATTSSTLKGSDRIDSTNAISWSPYGCHYFPDPRSFPSPKLETLPKEPLRKGEQYFLDLGGNIRKGPVGVGNTCYCGPFFKHIEEKINRNRKSIRKYVYKATERLDSKVQALAIRTDDQIEQLTRSMIADRIRCESRRIHLEHWLKRGEPHRLTTGQHYSKSRRKKENPSCSTLTRSKSLEILDNDSLGNSRLPSSRSFDILKEAAVTVHRAAENSDGDDDDEIDGAGSALSVVSIGQVTTFDGDQRWDGLEADYHNVSERLEELLAKTNEILEMEKEASKRRKEELLAFTEPTVNRRKERRGHNAILSSDIMEQLQQTSLHDGVLVDESIAVRSIQAATVAVSPNSPPMVESSIQREVETIPGADRIDTCSQTGEDERRITQILGYSLENDEDDEYFSRMQPRRNAPPCESSGASNLSQNSANLPSPMHPHHHHHQDENHNFQYQNFAQIQGNEHNMLQNVISALRKDHQRVRDLIETETMNESENTYEDKLSYKDDQTLLNVNGLFHNTCFDDYSHIGAAGVGLDSPSNTLKSEKVTMTSVKDISELCETAVIEKTVLPNNAQLNRFAASQAPHLDNKDWRRKPLKNNNNKDYEDLTERVSGTIKKVEIKNGEIKTLKKPSSGGILKRSKVQELVARLQGKLSSTPKVTEVKKAEESESESSEDEQNEHNENLSIQTYQQRHQFSHNQSAFPVQATMYPYNRAQPQIAASNANNNLQHGLGFTSEIPAARNNNLFGINMQQQSSSSSGMHYLGNYMRERVIPKDAYFHELPNKNRNSPATAFNYSNATSVMAARATTENLSNNNNYYHHQHPTMSPLHQFSQQLQQQQPSITMERRDCPPCQPVLPSMSSPNFAPNNMPPLTSHQPPQPLRAPVNEKLLSNRKFIPMSVIGSVEGSTSPDYEMASLKNCNQIQSMHLLQQHHHLHQQQQQQQQQIPTLSSITIDSHLVERDISNDSGFSTRMYGGNGSHRPSPSLSGQTDYASGGMQSPTTVLFNTSPSANVGIGISGNAGDNGGEASFYIGNVSSLV